MKRLNQVDIVALVAEKSVITVGVKTTVVVLTLTNGFEVVGTASCIDPKNYDVKTGEEIALKRAMDKVWELAGYYESRKCSDSGYPEADPRPTAVTDDQAVSSFTDPVDYPPQTEMTEDLETK